MLVNILVMRPSSVGFGHVLEQELKCFHGLLNVTMICVLDVDKHIQCVDAFVQFANAVIAGVDNLQTYHLYGPSDGS